MFPSTVVSPADSPSLLISGHNNRKIGKVVTKGEWAGMPIYTLTLEERATCPSTCFMYSKCYGNAMHMARRHKHGPELEAYLKAELIDLADEHPDGFIVRLHVLGDFYSVEYVRFWQRMLGQLPQLRIFGYTARSIGTADGIGSAIAVLNGAYTSRSFIRFSSDKYRPMGATVITRMPESSVVPEGVVCPAETSDTDCCATCGLCWSPAMKQKTIVFVAHGLGASTAKAVAREVAKPDKDGMRQIRGLAMTAQKPSPPSGNIIGFEMIDPKSLWVDEKYQRRLAAKGVKLIQKIAVDWDWRKFNPPTVVMAEDGKMHVIDGQHTAIAAVTRGDLDKIPVKLVGASTLQERAATFVGINSDRTAVTPVQLFYAEIAAGDAKAVAAKKMCDEAGVTVLRFAPPRGEFSVGETFAVATMRRLRDKQGHVLGVRILKMLVDAGIAPINDWAVGAVILLLTSPKFKPQVGDDDLKKYLAAHGKQLPMRAGLRNAETGERLPMAAANIIWKALTK